MAEKVRVGKEVKVIENGVIHDVPVSTVRWRDVVFAFAMLLGVLVALGQLVTLLGGG